MHLGLDLGGTKIEAVAMSDGGEIHCRHRVPTPGDDYTAIVAAVADLVAQVEGEVGSCVTVGIGTPGSASPLDSLMRNSNTTCLNGRPLQRDLEQALGRPIRLANDANCFALSEAVDGAGAGESIVFGVIIGTGVGGGIVVDGRVLQGPATAGSEWGHNPLPGLDEVFENQQRRCYCGNTNCIETYLSGPGLAKTYELISGDQRSAKSVVGLSSQGDEFATQALTLYQQQLACALSQVVNILDPDVIVLGGGMSNAETLYTTIPGLWQQWIFSDAIGTALRPAKYGDSSGVRGAAWLWR